MRNSQTFGQRFLKTAGIGSYSYSVSSPIKTDKDDKIRFQNPITAKHVGTYTSPIGKDSQGFYLQYPYKADPKPSSLSYVPSFLTSNIAKTTGGTLVGGLLGYGTEKLINKKNRGIAGAAIGGTVGGFGTYLYNNPEEMQNLVDNIKGIFDKSKK